MRLLLTSAGIKNQTIHDALVGLLGKPVGECDALCIPTAGYGHPMGSPDAAWRFISGREPRCPMTELEWRSEGVLELTALPSVGDDRWITRVREVDVLLVNGGDALYLSHWMRESGLADLLPSLRETVWVGLSAGSMVMTPRIGKAFMQWQPPTGSDETLGLVDFSIFPHLDHPDLPENTLENAQRWAATIPGPAYAIDDDTAISVVDGAVDIVSEGHWKLLPPRHREPQQRSHPLAFRAGAEDEFGIRAILSGKRLVTTPTAARMRSGDLGVGREPSSNTQSHSLDRCGPTDLDNGALPCGRHHTIEHRDQLAGRLVDGQVL